MPTEEATGGSTNPAAQMEQAIAEAIESSGYDPSGATDDDTWDNAGLDFEPDGTSSTVEAPATGASPEATGTGEEPPTSYWGVDLSDIPAERRAEVIAHFEQQDSTIRKLQDRLSAPEEPAPPTADDDVAVEDVTDEDLLRAAGYDPEDFEVQSNAKFLVPQLRTQLALEDQVATLSRQVQGREVETTWNKQLDDLEATYGKLPGDRVAVLQEAVRQGYSTPFETYFRLQAPVRREVESAAAAARREGLKREQGASPRPRGGDVDPAPISKDMSLRDAVAASMKAASKKTGLSWKKAVRGGYAENLLDR